MPKPKPKRPLDPRPKKDLQELDPSWGGETPELPRPINLSSDGQERLRAALLRAPDPNAAYGRLADAALRAFHGISTKWGLSEEDQKEILGAYEVPHLEILGKKGWGIADFEALECFSHILGIYASLHTLFSSEANADAWIKKPNSAPPFSGRAALEVMREGITGLRVVRTYLEAEVFCFHPPQNQ